MKWFTNLLLIIFIIIAHATSLGDFDGPLGGIGIIAYTIPLTIAWVCSLIAFNVKAGSRILFGVMILVSCIISGAVTADLAGYEINHHIISPILLFAFNVALAIDKIANLKFARQKAR